MHAERPKEKREATHDDHDVKRTTCCIVVGGPAGAVLGLLLARKRVNVTLLEAHPDFDREFRGDTDPTDETKPQIGFSTHRGQGSRTSCNRPPHELLLPLAPHQRPDGVPRMRPSASLCRCA
jgi:NADPH-dependent 2,4-dienoyl-CoA reductase/sulfur reductase-like enzyme